MQLTLVYLAIEASIHMDAPTADCRCDMIVSPAWLQDAFEEFCTGEDDGRGIPMAPGAFTPMGIEGVFTRMGIDVAGVGEVAPDLDGEEGGQGEPEEEPGEPEPLLDEHVPRHVAEHYALLDKLKR